VGLNVATSGSVDFNQTRNEIINDAFQLIGVYGVGRTVSSEDMTFASSMLNKMVKAWQAQGIHLFAQEEGVLFVADNTGEYTLSNASASARATKWSDAVLTEIATAASASATTLVVDSTAGMTAADIIGIVGDDDSVTWTTIVSVDSSTGLTITAGLDAAAAVGNNVYTFTSRLNKPLKIHNMRRTVGIETTSTDGEMSEIPMTQLSREDFMNLPSKGINGQSSHYYYDPNLTDGTLHLWPRPDDPEQFFRFTYTRMLEDFDASTNNPDFPSEWLEVLTYQLAVRLAPAFGKDEKMLASIVPIASQLLENMLNWDNEVGSMYLMPDHRN